MAFLDAAQQDDFVTLDPHRNIALGLGLSALMPLAALFAVVGIVSMLGLGEIAPFYAAPFANPIAGAFFVALFPMWGAAHWLAAREGAEGHRAARWVMAVIGWGLLTPFVAGIADPFFLNWSHVVTLFLVGGTAVQLAPVSRPALLLMLPGVLWAALAAIPGYVILTNGWSPGFAVTVAAIERS